MKGKNGLLKIMLRLLIFVLVGGYFTSSLMESTFAIDSNKDPNVFVTIQGDGSISQTGNLFDGQLYPATVEQVEEGIGGISGIIRVRNDFRNISIENLAIGIYSMDIRNDYSYDEVFNSFLRNIKLKVENGVLLSFSKNLIEYTSLDDILFKSNSQEYLGYTLNPLDRFSLSKGDTVDLKYTLNMTLEAGNELESVTAYMPIYINLMENISNNGGDDDDDDDEEIITEPIPEAALNKKDHIQYIQGYPNNTVRPEGLITREEVAAVFYRLLEAGYRSSIWTIDENFPDVDSNRWSIRHIATLANGKIINGYPDSNFKPGNFITRAELATIASKFDKLTPSHINMFSDIKAHWANKYISSAATKGWVNGYPDGTFKPDQYVTRAEFVTLVNNVLERRVHKEDISPEAKKFPDLKDTMWYYEAMQEAINSHLYIRLEDSYENWIEIYYPTLDM